MASNAVPHGEVSGWSLFKYNYTTTSTSGGNPTSTTYQCPSPPGSPFNPQCGPTSISSVPLIAVVTSDQAAAQAALQQLGGPNGAIFAAAIFKTPQASSLLAQAFIQFNLGKPLYISGQNFTQAKTDLQNAVSLLNQAISAETSHGNALETNTMVADYGSLLLSVVQAPRFLAHYSPLF